MLTYSRMVPEHKSFEMFFGLARQVFASVALLVQEDPTRETLAPQILAFAEVKDDLPSFPLVERQDGVAVHAPKVIGTMITDRILVLEATIFNQTIVFDLTVIDGITLC